MNNSQIKTFQKYENVTEPTFEGTNINQNNISQANLQMRPIYKFNRQRITPYKIVTSNDDILKQPTEGVKQNSFVSETYTENRHASTTFSSVDQEVGSSLQQTKIRDSQKNHMVTSFQKFKPTDTVTRSNFFNFLRNGTINSTDKNGINNTLIQNRNNKLEPKPKKNNDTDVKIYKTNVDYDYYDEDNLGVIEKTRSQVKVILRGANVIECLDQGTFSHPLSCRKFISCAKMGKETSGVIGWEYTCPKGLSYDPVGEICNWAAGLGCKD